MFSLNAILHHVVHFYCAFHREGLPLQLSLLLLIALSITFPIAIFHEKKCSLGLTAAMQLGRAPSPIRATADHLNASRQWHGYFYAQHNGPAHCANPRDLRRY